MRSSPTLANNIELIYLQVNLALPVSERAGADTQNPPYMLINLLYYNRRLYFFHFLPASDQRTMHDIRRGDCPIRPTSQQSMHMTVELKISSWPVTQLIRFLHQLVLTSLHLTFPYVCSQSSLLYSQYLYSSYLDRADITR